MSPGSLTPRHSQRHQPLAPAHLAKQNRAQQSRDNMHVLSTHPSRRRLNRSISAGFELQQLIQSRTRVMPQRMNSRKNHVKYETTKPAAIKWVIQ
jgi:hypothetical protein